MDSDLIYAKTGAGEQAMLHRTQVTQRSLRTVLILVDGQSTVAELCARTGNREQTEEALAELEKGGFIEIQVEEDSLWIESKKVEEEIRAAASNNPHPLPPVNREPISRPPPAGSKATAPNPVPRQLSRDSAPKRSGRESPSRAKPPAGDGRVFVQSRPQGALSSEFSISQYSFPPMVVGRTSVENSTRGPGLSYLLRPLAAGKGLAVSFAAQMHDALRKMRPSTRTVAPRPLRRPRRHGSLAGNLALTSLIVVALLSLTVVFFPYEEYLPEVESALAQAAGRPVKVGSMRVSVYPAPVLALADVSVAMAEETIHADTVRLEPVVTSLASPHKRFRNVVLSGLTLSAPSIAALVATAASSARPESPAAVGALVFEKTDVAFGGSVFSDLTGKADLTEQGLVRSLRLASADRSLELTLTPGDGRVDFSVDAVAWRPAKDSPFFFDSLNIKGEVDRRLLTVRAMDLRLLGGVVNGAAVFSADPQPEVSGEVWFERLDGERLLAAVGIRQKLTGEAAGKLQFQASAKSWPTLLKELSADGDFTVQRGTLRGIDLAEAVRRISQAPVQGGVTAFERMTGRIRMTSAEYQLSGLVIDSGLMHTTGRVRVGKDFKLSGRMELQMRGTMNQTSVPVAVSGSLDNTVVQVSR